MIRCTVCQHPRVADINHLLVAGRSGRSLAAEFGTSPAAMRRHAKSHLEVVPRGTTSPKPDAVDPLVELLAALRTRALASGDAAMAREYRLALAALTEQTSERPAYDVLADPGWIRLRTILLEALEPFPEARLAVADAIREALVR